MTQNRQAGFTLPEMLSVMVVTVMFSGLVIYFAFSYWSSTATLQADLETYVSRLNASDILRESINESSGIITQNSIEDINSHKADAAIVSGTYWEPIHAVPGTIPNTPATFTPVLYYRKPSTDAAKNVIFNGLQPYEDEYVLFMDGTTKELVLRSLANPGATGNRTRTSCPRAAVTAACPGDRLVAENVQSMEMRYFSRSGNLIDYQSIVDSDTGEFIGPDFPAVEVLEFKMTSFKKSKVKGGQDTLNETIVRVALRSS